MMATPRVIPISRIQESGRRLALAGAALWLVLLLLLRPPHAMALFLPAPLVALPLGLPLAAPRAPTSLGTGRWLLALRIQLPAALLLAGSFALSPGAAAGLLAVPWLLFTAAAAVLGILRFAERGGPGPIAELAIDLALLFLPVGGAWLVASRLGVGLMGFSEPIVFLTASHFHFAGFVLALVAGLAARALPGSPSRAAALGVITGVPLVAAGITLTRQGIRWVELIAACWLSTAAILVAAVQLRLASRVRSGGARALLILSALSLAAAMLLAAAYALGNHLGAPWLDIPAMIASHAALNVVGFALPALLFWTLPSSGGVLQGVADPPAGLCAARLVPLSTM